MTDKSVRFDHFITYVEAPTVEQHLDRYRTAGFRVAEQTVRHEPGLRTGFVFLGEEAYIEFAWVENESQFAAGAKDEIAYRHAHRPYGLGFASDDVSAVHEAWIKRGYRVRDVWGKAPRDAVEDAEPAWSFQEVPPDLLPGAACFVLTYHQPGQKADRSPGLNTIFSLAGPIFVSEMPEERATAWRDLLAPSAPVAQSEWGFDFWLGSHHSTWMSPAGYRARFGLEWVLSPHACGELALLHVLAYDLGRATAAIQGADWSAGPIVMDKAVFVPPNPVDGFSFLITQAVR